MRNATSIHYLLKLFLIFLIFSPTVALAHASADGSGFMAGFTHPIFGFDHLLAMVSVGILSSLLGGSQIWRIPFLFVGAMIVGGIIGIYQIGLLYGEIAISLSVIILGFAIIRTDKTTKVALISIFVIFFGAFHGHAHGLEMPNSSSPVYYTFGFIVSTSILHIIGVIVGEVSVSKDNMLKSLRYIGAGISGAGFLILFQHIGIA